MQSVELGVAFEQVGEAVLDQPADKGGTIPRAER
jgi:hypothetical protein